MSAEPSRVDVARQRRCSRCGTLGHTVATCARRELRAALDAATFELVPSTQRDLDALNRRIDALRAERRWSS